ncbi:MAG: hydrolase Nlp/P60 [Bacteroidota bacterium]|nr:hydrolase Nlp/P60 [Bacteroidota bacterium]
MSFGICSLSIVPCRKEPSGTSEMVTQLLFGETYTIIEDGEDWLKIATNYDNYPCWLNAKQHTRISDAEYKSLQSSILSSELVQVISGSDRNSVFPITVGATLPNFSNGKLNCGDSEFLFEGQMGTALSFVEEAEAGDLAFFDNEDGNIVHVGMVLENQQIIHASGCVRIDKFDHYGIFHSDNKKYSHMLRVIKKVI